MQTSEAMYVDMKMSITTVGAHDGLIVHSGVQCGSQSASLIWPYPRGTQLPSMPSVQFAPTPTPVRESLQWHREPSPPPSPAYSFERPESPPSEFIKPDNVQLNVFQVDPADLSDAELRRIEPKKSPSLPVGKEELLNDTVTTTTTVEVFRTNVDLSKPDEYLTLPPVPAPGFDSRPQVLKAIGPEYEKWSDTRTETLINDPRRWVPTGPTISSPAVSPSPHGGIVRARIPSSSAHSPSAIADSRGAAEYFEAIPRRAEEIHPGAAPFRDHSTFPQKAITGYGGQGDAPRFDGDRARRPTTPRLGVAPQQPFTHRPQAAIAVRDGSLKQPLRNATSEEIFHLYQTRDALGNVRAQCDMGIDLNEEEMTAAAPLVDSEESIISETSARGDRSRSDLLENFEGEENPPRPSSIPSFAAEITVASPSYGDSPEQLIETKPSLGFFETLPLGTAHPVARSSVSPAGAEDKASEVEGQSSSEEVFSSVPDLTACPSKSILHVVRRPVRHGRRAPKTVRFPSRQSQVTVKDHRLFITDLDSESDDAF